MLVPQAFPSTFLTKKTRLAAVHYCFHAAVYVRCLAYVPDTTAQGQTPEAGLLLYYKITEIAGVHFETFGTPSHLVGLCVE